jgi:AcrR family transcriptional regulator
MDSETIPGVGRPRDTAIDEAVLDETLHQLARDGLAALSLASVAAAAGTSRPAIYRRWPDKESLVVEAIARLARVDPPAASGDPFEDLVAELEHFRHCITMAGSLPVAGMMLGDGVQDRVRDAYRDGIVAPRRARIRGFLAAGVESGRLDADADLLVASSFLTGSWYALALAGTDPPDDWARRVATLVWTACGGTDTSAPRTH